MLEIWGVWRGVRRYGGLGVWAGFRQGWRCGLADAAGVEARCGLFCGGVALTLHP